MTQQRTLKTQEISDGLDVLYGTGSTRVLRPGEEAAIVNKI
jgi:hypothetical protein